MSALETRNRRLAIWLAGVALALFLLTISGYMT